MSKRDGVVRVCAITFDWYPFDPLVRRLSEAAISAGYSADVICLGRADEPRTEICNGVHVYRMPMDRGFGRSLPSTLLEWGRFLLLAAYQVTRLHLKQRYDVIHVHNMPDFLALSALIPQLMGAKVILEIQDTAPELMATKAKGGLRKAVIALAKFQERISTTIANHVITVGWPFEELLLRRGVSEKKLTVILNSADPKLFPPSRRPQLPDNNIKSRQPFVVMYHGTVAERNGLDTALRAVAIAHKTVPQLRFAIKGRGEYIQTLKLMVKELDIADIVVFSEPSPSDQIVDFVVHGDVGIIPYRNDSFMELVLPTKAYEFAWMRRPIIASDTRAIRSMFGPTSVMLCNPESPESFAEAIIELYENPEKRRSLIENAALDYEPYRWEQMAERYTQLLASLSHKTLPIKQQSTEELLKV